MEKWRRGETDKDGNPISFNSDREESYQKLSSTQVRRLLVHLRLDSLPSLFTFIALLADDKEAKELKAIEEEDPTEKGEDQLTTQPMAKRPLEVHGLRILELTERTSSVMQVTEGEEYYSARDPVVNAFRTFSQLNDVAVSGRVAIVPESSYAETLTRQAADVSSDFVLVPWSEYGSITEDASVPFLTSAQDRYNGRGHLDFINRTLEGAVCNTGVFINHGFGGMGPAERPSPDDDSNNSNNNSHGLTFNLGRARSAATLSIHSQRGDAAATLPVRDKTHNIFLPFLGGLDDRVALRLALQLARNPHVILTVAHLSWTADDDDDDVDDQIVEVPSRAHILEGGSKINSNSGGGGAGGGAPGVSSGRGATKGGREPVKVVEEASAQDLALLSSLQSSLPRRLSGRVTFTEVSVTRRTAAAEAVAHARRHVGGSPRNAGDVVIVGRAHRGLGDEGQAGVGGAGELRRAVGLVAEQLLLNGAVKASLLVVKAGGAGLQW